MKACFLLLWTFKQENMLKTGVVYTLFYYNGRLYFGMLLNTVNRTLANYFISKKYSKIWYIQSFLDGQINFLNLNWFFMDSILTCNSKGVLSPFLQFRNMALAKFKKKLKKKLISISTMAIKVCMYYSDNIISFENIHKMNKRAWNIYDL